MRTRHYSPETNGVVERFNQSLKYEHLYPDRDPERPGPRRGDRYLSRLYNRIRPHESLGFTPPIHTYLAKPT